MSEEERQKDAQKGAPTKAAPVSEPSVVPTPPSDPDFVEQVTDDLATDAAEGLQLTRELEADGDRGAGGITLEEIGVPPDVTPRPTVEPSSPAPVTRKDNPRAPSTPPPSED